METDDKEMLSASDHIPTTPIADANNANIPLEDRFPFLREHTGRRRSRQLLTPEQTTVLLKILEHTMFPSTAVREAVARDLGITPRKVQVFFQNKRQSLRKKMLSAGRELVNLRHSHQSFPHDLHSKQTGITQLHRHRALSQPPAVKLIGRQVRSHASSACSSKSNVPPTSPSSLETLSPDVARAMEESNNASARPRRAYTTTAEPSEHFRVGHVHLATRDQLPHNPCSASGFAVTTAHSQNCAAPYSFHRRPWSPRREQPPRLSRFVNVETSPAGARICRSFIERSWPQESTLVSSGSASSLAARRSVADSDRPSLAFAARRSSYHGDSRLTPSSPRSFGTSHRRHYFLPSMSPTSCQTVPRLSSRDTIHHTPGDTGHRRKSRSMERASPSTDRGTTGGLADVCDPSTPRPTCVFGPQQQNEIKWSSAEHPRDMPPTGPPGIRRSFSSCVVSSLSHHHFGSCGTPQPGEDRKWRQRRGSICPTNFDGLSYESNSSSSAVTDFSMTPSAPTTWDLSGASSSSNNHSGTSSNSGHCARKILTQDEEMHSTLQRSMIRLSCRPQDDDCAINSDDAELELDSCSEDGLRQMASGSRLKRASSQHRTEDSQRPVSCRATDLCLNDATLWPTMGLVLPPLRRPFSTETGLRRQWSDATNAYCRFSDNDRRHSDEEEEEQEQEKGEADGDGGVDFEDNKEDEDTGENYEDNDACSRYASTPMSTPSPTDRRFDHGQLDGHGDERPDTLRQSPAGARFASPLKSELRTLPSIAELTEALGVGSAFPAARRLEAAGPLSASGVSKAEAVVR